MGILACPRRDREGGARLGGLDEGAVLGEPAGLPEQPGGGRGVEGFSDHGATSTATPTSGSGSNHNLGAPTSTVDRRRPARPPSSSRSTWPTRSNFGNNVMPPYGKQAGGAFTATQLAQVGEFLTASKGPGNGRLTAARHGTARVGFAGMRVFLGITGASGRALREAARRGARRGRVRGRRLRVRRRRSRCSRPSSTATPRLLARRGARAAARAARPATVTVYDPNDWQRAVRVAARRRSTPTSICPCSMGTLGTLASGAMPEPDPPRRVGGAEGGAQARARARARRRSR